MSKLMTKKNEEDFETLNRPGDFDDFFLFTFSIYELGLGSRLVPPHTPLTLFLGSFHSVTVCIEEIMYFSLREKPTVLQSGEEIEK